MPDQHHPAASSPLVGVSYVMPVLNDATHVRAAVESILAQDYTGPVEVLIALGPSIDGTGELVADLAARDARVRVLENEVGSTPAGLNIGIRAARYPVVVRVDSHSMLPTDYARVAVGVLERTGADNVGGIMDARGETPFERRWRSRTRRRSASAARRSTSAAHEGPAETVYLGVFRRAALERVGLFDETIKRGQDWELNRRLRETGGTVWFTPELAVTYRPRSTRRAARPADVLDRPLARRARTPVPGGERHPLLHPAGHGARRRRSASSSASPASCRPPSARRRGCCSASSCPRSTCSSSSPRRSPTRAGAAPPWRAGFS